MKNALILNAINPKIGGVLVFGEKGTAKSTAVRALTRLLPEMDVVKGCPFHCSPDNPEEMCDDCYHRYLHGETLERETMRMPVVDLPVSATEDRVVGSLDIEAAIQTGKKKFEPGVLAMANRGILYVDEINLLDDHIVDLLLDSAAMGINTVEREGISFSHPARFILVGTMNPEEGELRPQLLDRFGLSVEIKGIADPQQRVKIMKLRGEYEEEPEKFMKQYEEQECQLCNKIKNGRDLLSRVEISDEILLLNARISIEMEVDGHRSDITLMKTEKTLAALRGKTEVTKEEVQDSVPMVFLHRMRMLPFETSRKIDMDRINDMINGENK
ncbi:MAG: ATP-binding protein [Eubacteriales bacterium]|nr:ATP-binding protein [Eubacteriales bacterium]